MLDTDGSYVHNEQVEYMREGCNLLVETEGEEMKITHADLNFEQTVYLIQFLVEKCEAFSGIDHDELLEDLKYGEESK